MVSISVLRAGVVPIYRFFTCILKGSPSVQTLCVFLPSQAPREGAFCQHPWGTVGCPVPRQGRLTLKKSPGRQELWDVGAWQVPLLIALLASASTHYSGGR